jgi:hypothetical protein
MVWGSILSWTRCCRGLRRQQARGRPSWWTASLCKVFGSPVGPWRCVAQAARPAGNGCNVEPAVWQVSPALSRALFAKGATLGWFSTLAWSEGGLFHGILLHILEDVCRKASRLAVFCSLPFIQLMHGMVAGDIGPPQTANLFFPDLG